MGNNTTLINLDSPTQHESRRIESLGKSLARSAELERSYQEQISDKKNLQSDPAVILTPSDEEISKIVEELNKTLAIVHTSTTYILLEKNEIDFVLDSKQSIQTLYENDVLVIDNKARSKAQIWLRSPNRRTFKNIVFNPRIIGHHDGNYNIWKGFAIKAVSGDCSLFWEHLKTIICCGKESHYLC